MPYIQVTLNGVLEREIPLQGKVTTIGRSRDCDICIDNSGVSELHARIRARAGRFVVEDARSRNGVLHAGQRIEQAALDFGDELTVVKHRLRLVEHASGQVSMPARSHSADAILQDETVEVDVSQLRQRLHSAPSDGGACLYLQGARGMRTDYPVSKAIFTIGKSDRSDLYLSGLFAPTRAASILRRADGYYIEPARRGRVRVNGMPTRASRKLQHGDGVQVRNVVLSFQERQPLCS